MIADIIAYGFGGYNPPGLRWVPTYGFSSPLAIVVVPDVVFNPQGKSIVFNPGTKQTVMTQPDKFTTWNPETKN
jgi:hypothetical protein